MRKWAVIGSLFILCSAKGWGVSDIAKDISITTKKSNAASGTTISTSTTLGNNQMFLAIGAQNANGTNAPTTTQSGLTFSSIRVLTNNGTVAAFVACSSVAVTAKTFTWNPAATSSMGFQIVSFINTACSPGCPTCGIGTNGTSIADSPSTVLASQLSTTVDRSYVVAVGVDASNGDTLVADSSDTFALSYTTDTATAWSGWVLFRTTVSTPSGVVVISSVSAVTSGGGSLAAMSVEILPVTTPFSTTLQPTAITGTTATGNGTVFTGGSNLSDVGTCFNLGGSPRIGSDTCVSGGSTEGTFTASLTGLTACTRYYTATYGTNAQGTTYGMDAPFVTTCPTGVFYTPGTGNQSQTPGVGSWGMD